MLTVNDNMKDKLIIEEDVRLNTNIIAPDDAYRHTSCRSTILSESKETALLCYYCVSICLCVGLLTSSTSLSRAMMISGAERLMLVDMVVPTGVASLM